MRQTVVTASFAVALVLATAPTSLASSSGVVVPGAEQDRADGYVSPYEISGIDTASTADLAARIASFTPTQQTASVPTTFPAAADWYTQSLYGLPGNASWGPAPLVLPRPRVPTALSTDDVVNFYEQRIVAAAALLIGTAYQHHHLPFWNPYANGFTPFVMPNPIPTSPPNQWPWSPVSANSASQQYAPVLAGSGWVMTPGSPFPNPYAAQYGTGAAGIDCSDLTSFVYSVAAGIYLNSAVGAQGAADASGNYSGTAPLGWNSTADPQLVDPAQSSDADVTAIRPAFIFGPNSTYNAATNTRGISTFNAPGSLDAVVAQLKPGDLLYVSDTTEPGNKVTHVVIWLGRYGTVVDPATGTASRVPLVISSHDNTPAVLDADSNLPALGQGNMPPPGVQILPFAQNNWFYSNFSHAMRVITSANVSGSRPENPARATRPTEGVLLVSQRVADRTDPRMLIHPPTRLAHAPTVSWVRGRPISLTAPGLDALAQFDVRISSGGKFVTVGNAYSDANGEARLPVVALTRADTYTVAIVDRVTERASFVRIQAVQ